MELNTQIIQLLTSSRVFRSHSNAYSIRIYLAPKLLNNLENEVGIINWDMNDRKIKIHINLNKELMKKVCFEQKIKHDEIIDQVMKLASISFGLDVIFEESEMSHDKKRYYIGRFPEEYTNSYKGDLYQILNKTLGKIIPNYYPDEK